MIVKARRGNIAVMLAVAASGAMAVCVMTLDVTRVESLRMELQHAADAGAHAGALEFMSPDDANPDLTVDLATAYARRYLTMQGAVDVDSVELGGWDDTSHHFYPGLTPFNAVRVVVSREPTGLLSRLGLAPLRLRARAVGWAAGDSGLRRIVLAQ